MKVPQQPIHFEPIYKGYVWGGNKIGRHFGRSTPPAPVAESWEVSAHPDGMSVVRSGDLAGKSLAEVVDACGPELMGRAWERFPLLIKILDAQQTLSVQVHPNDETAARFGGEAKTEMWIILEAEPDAAVYCGLTDGVDEAALRAAIASEDIEPVLRRIPVQSGDAIFVPGGSIHAIAAGCLLLEVQQNSNTTYRIYDWGRGRETHLDKGLQVTNWNAADPMLTPEAIAPGCWLLQDSPWFRVEKWAVDGSTSIEAREDSFQVLFVAEGDAKVCGESTSAGHSLLLPAGVGADLTGNATVYRVFVP